MADILSQEEIDALLDVVDEEEYEEGSPEFEEAVQKLRQKGLESARCRGNSPSEIIEGLKKSRAFYVKTLKEFKEFDTHYKEIQKIVREQPELFI